MTIRLRGHHLLCMLTYIGKGYSPAFVENYDTIAGRLSKGEDILLIDGPDDICAPLLCGGDCHCHDEGPRNRDNVAIKDVGLLFGETLSLYKPFTLDDKRLSFMRAAFAQGTLRTACIACEWYGLCTKIAVSDNFANVKITGVKITRPPVSN